MKLSRSFENQSETGVFDGRAGHTRYQYAIAAHYPVPNTIKTMNWATEVCLTLSKL